MARHLKAASRLVHGVYSPGIRARQAGFGWGRSAKWAYGGIALLWILTDLGLEQRQNQRSLGTYEDLCLTKCCIKLIPSDVVKELIDNTKKRWTLLAEGPAESDLMVGEPKKAFRGPSLVRLLERQS